MFYFCPFSWTSHFLIYTFHFPSTLYFSFSFKWSLSHNFFRIFLESIKKNHKLIWSLVYIFFKYFKLNINTKKNWFKYLKKKLKKLVERFEDKMDMFGIGNMRKDCALISDSMFCAFIHTPYSHHAHALLLFIYLSIYFIFYIFIFKAFPLNDHFSVF